MRLGNRIFGFKNFLAGLQKGFFIRKPFFLFLRIAF